MQSSKWQALGNTYVVVEPEQAGGLDGESGSRALAGLGRRSRGAVDDGRHGRDRRLEPGRLQGGALGERDENRRRLARRANWRDDGTRAGRGSGCRSAHPVRRGYRAGARGRHRRRARRGGRDRARPGRRRESARGRRGRSGRRGPTRPAPREPPPVPSADERPGRARRPSRRGHRSRLGARGGGDALFGHGCGRGRGCDARRRRRASSTSPGEISGCA